MKPKAKKVLKIAAKWEAANIALWLLQGRPKRPNGSAKSLSLILNLTDGVAANAAIKQTIAAAPQYLEAATISKPTAKPVGLIMWDGAHNSYDNDPTAPYDKTITQANGMRVKISRLKERGIHLLPFYGRHTAPQQITVYSKIVTDPTTGRKSYGTETVTVDWDYNQSVMDQQIRYAAQAGFSYLAFCHYATESPVSIGRRLFASSQRRGSMKMCFIDPNLGQNPNQTIAEIVAEMRKPYYMRINGKPVLYYTEKNIPVANQIKAAFGGELYRIALNNDLYNMPTNLTGYDGGTNYITPGFGFGGNHDYNGIIAQAADNFNKFIQANPGKRTVPNLTTGAANYQKIDPFDRPGYTNPATREQLIQAILQFKQQLAASSSDTALVYAGTEWVENANCVFPTKNPNGSLNTMVLETFIKYL